MFEKGRREVLINVVSVAASLGNVKVLFILCTYYSIEVSLKTVAECIANKLVEQENGKAVVRPKKKTKKRKYKCTLKREMRKNKMVDIVKYINIHSKYILTFLLLKKHYVNYSTWIITYCRQV